MVHKNHISIKLSFKTFTFGCTMLTICNGIVSNVCKSAMSHCERNVAYMRFGHYNFNIIVHTIVHLTLRPKYIRWSNKAYNYDLTDARKGIQY